MKFHWVVLLCMLAGVGAGLLLQATTDDPASDGGSWSTDADGGARLDSAPAKSPVEKAGLAAGTVVDLAILHLGAADEDRRTIATADDLLAAYAASDAGDILWLRPRGREIVGVTLKLEPDSARARVLFPFDFAADVFLQLLKMLIVPLVLSSIVAGVASVGAMKDLRSMGLRTFAYYISTSLMAVLLGQVLVNVIRPGDGAALGLPATNVGTTEENFLDVLKRMVPENVIASMGDNGSMLAIIFFALLFGVFITKSEAVHRERMTGFFDSFFAVMLKMAQGVLALLPIGVFCLMMRVVANTGFGVFEPLLLYMLTVLAALVLHACLTLPMVLRFIGGLSPRKWMKAMSPALMTAFSTSSSSMTLPVTLETVEKRGKVSNGVTSFTLPLGATINMDGTALYECIGVVFLAQYYESVGAFDLTVMHQVTIVFMALLASIGAAGIPSAGLVMMLTILTTLGLPIEGAALLLAVDRPLDMLRTVVNVWSDSCGAAVIASSRGETGLAEGV